MPNMPANSATRDIGPRDPGAICVDFGKSVVRLTVREWVAAGLLLLACFVSIPRLWERCEPLTVSADYRVPYGQNEDYWTYHRLIETIDEADRIPVIGDSFVWGEYVSPAETFNSFLNAETSSSRFANAGLNGAHPLALCGLVQNYAGNLKRRRVILHCNLLWMSAPERDLQTGKDIAFNHPRLVPQFYPRIASYKAPISKRLGILIGRRVPFFGLITHMRICCFDGLDLQSWSIANPYADPLARLEPGPAHSPAEEPHHEPVPWTRQGIERQDLPWIDLDSSIQWSAWREAAEFLRSNENDVLVVIGPFNEHLLLEGSRRRYRALKEQVEAWLRTHEFRYLAPALLPSDEYGDASHPLSAGYARLAGTVVRDRAFGEWFNGQ